MHLSPFCLCLTPLPSVWPMQNKWVRRPHRLLDYALVLTLSVELLCRFCLPWYSAFAFANICFETFTRQQFSCWYNNGLCYKQLFYDWSSSFSLKRWSSLLYQPFSIPKFLTLCTHPLLGLHWGRWYAKLLPFLKVTCIYLVAPSKTMLYPKSE